MIAARYFRLPVYVGSTWSRNLYFYQTHAGLWDAQFWWEYSRCMHGSFTAAVRDFIDGLKREHRLVERGLAVHLGQPVETSYGEIQAVRHWIKSATLQGP
jgi:hypothetical protein